MAPRLITFLLWALAAASITFWGLSIYAGAPGASGAAPALDIGAPPPRAADLASLLGAPAQAADSNALVNLSARMRLDAVIASSANGSSGIALITLDGKPSHPYKVGANVDGDLVLQSVATRSATLGPAQGAPAIVLELPTPSVAAIARAGANASAPEAAPSGIRPAGPNEATRNNRRNRLRGHLQAAQPD